MAEVVSVALADIDNAIVDLYTVPADKSAIVFSLYVANKDAAARTVTVTIVKAAGGITVQIAPAITVQPNQTLIVIGDSARVGLMEGDKVRVGAGTGTNVLDAFLSAMQEDV